MPSDHTPDWIYSCCSLLNNDWTLIICMHLIFQHRGFQQSKRLSSLSEIFITAKSSMKSAEFMLKIFGSFRRAFRNNTERQVRNDNWNEIMFLYVITYLSWLFLFKKNSVFFHFLNINVQVANNGMSKLKGYMFLSLNLTNFVHKQKGNSICSCN